LRGCPTDLARSCQRIVQRQWPSKAVLPLWRHQVARSKWSHSTSQHLLSRPERFMRGQKPIPVAWAVVLLFPLLVVQVASALALECPVPQALTGPGVLEESPAQTERVGVATGDDDNRVRVLVEDLRSRYPSAQNAEIINYLMAAYCRVIGQ